MEAIQGSAPMQGSADLVPLDAPTANPGEPVTAGADAGAGIGPQAAGITDDSSATLEQLAPLVKSLTMAANLPNATPETRTFVRALQARLAGRG